jgi:hypothetical protein
VFDGEGRFVTALNRQVEELESSTTERFAARATGTKLRRYKRFYDAAGCWSRVGRIIARVEVGPQGADTRYILTDLEGRAAREALRAVCGARGQPIFRRSSRCRLAASTKSRLRSRSSRPTKPPTSAAPSFTSTAAFPLPSVGRLEARRSMVVVRGRLGVTATASRGLPYPAGAMALVGTAQMRNDGARSPGNPGNVG